MLHGENQRWAYVTVAATVTDNLQAGGRTQEETARLVEDFIAEIVPRFQPGGQDGRSGGDTTPRAEVGATPVPTPNGI